MTDVYKNVRIPGPNDKVYKDECVYSFDNPESENGLFICMSTFRGLGNGHIARHCKLNPGKNVFLHILRRRKLASQNSNVKSSKVVKIESDIKSSFHTQGSNHYILEEKYSIYIHPNKMLAYPDEINKLPEHVKRSAQAIINTDSTLQNQRSTSMNEIWNEGGTRPVTKHAQTLVQFKNGRKIPPNGWKCDECDLKDNLWLNLTDGSILCGRKYFDGTGGNNHAITHYYKTKYPLAVKLGTVSAKGADVYSHDEDDMVEDPNLANHLSHWGINMMNMEKTDRTMDDLVMELNQKYGEASMIEDPNSKLQLVHGAGYTGMINLGYSGYMNCVLQVLFTIKDFQEKYYKHCDFYFDNAKDPVNDFNAQTAKLAFGLLSGLYSRELPVKTDPSFKPPTAIRPQMFWSLIGCDHSYFGTETPQDAVEFLEYFNELVHKHRLNDPTPDASLDPSSCFQFQLEERIYCPETNQVQYLTRNDSIFRINIPLHTSRNMHEVLHYIKTKEDLEKQGKNTHDLLIVRPIIPLTEAIAYWAQPEVFDTFQLKPHRRNTGFQRTCRFLTFPDYLLVQLKKYTFNADWTPKKLDVSMEVPDLLDIESLRATGFQNGETPMPDDDEPVVQATTTKTKDKINEVLLQQLVDMGFSVEGCKKALINTGNNDVEAALNWVFEHQSDPDFDTLTQSSPSQHSTGRTKHFRDGIGQYRLVAFISHIGKNLTSGKYVAHILKDNRWVIFNDEIVALSEHPPKDLGYLYFYKRITS